MWVSLVDFFLKRGRLMFGLGGRVNFYHNLNTPNFGTRQDVPSIL
jgi:hypothetical protein